MKRIFCWIALMFLLCCAATAQAVAPGETVTVTFEIADNPQGAISARVGFEFDTSVLSFVSAEKISADVQTAAPIHDQGKFGMLNINGIAPGVVGTVALRISEDAPCGVYEIVPVIDSTYDRSLAVVPLEVLCETIVIDHTWDAGVVTTPPTCEEAGVRTYSCLTCPATRTGSIAPTGHTEGVGIPTKVATCLTEGELTYYCKVCNQAVRTEVVPATDHAPGDTVITVEPTCLVPGKQVTQCAYCGKTIASAEIQAMGHAYNGSVNCEATCTAEGYTADLCARCGAEYNRVVYPALGHLESRIGAYDPTCTTPGQGMSAFCERCHVTLYIGEAIPPLGHDYVNNACTRCGELLYDPATCPHEHISFDQGYTSCWGGLTDGSHCADCGKVLVAQTTIPVQGHDYVREVTRAATCTETGVMTYTCSRCGLNYTESIPLAAHTPATDGAVQPDCVNTGLTEGSHCSVCGLVLTERESIPARGHNYTFEVTAQPSCTAEGVTTYTCVRCGDVYTEGIPMTAHTRVTDERVEPGCETVGYTAGVHCGVCGRIQVAQVQIPALGHHYNSEVTTEAKCEAEGVITYTCGGCGDTYTESIPATGHTEAIDAAMEPTCEATGLTEGTHCEVCGEVLTAQQEVAATGHSWQDGEVITEATCTAEGEQQIICANDASHVSSKVLPALGHTEAIDAAMEPTCEATGLTEGSHCEVCGEVLTAQQEVAATGHSWQDGEVITEATCTAEGEQQIICANDASHVSSKVLPALGHTPGADAVVNEPTCTEKGSRNYTCEICGAVVSAEEIEALGHDYVGEVTTEPTCTQEGVRTLTCSRCGDARTEAISAVGHTETADAAVEPTCETTGLTEGSHCEVCGEVLTAQQVIPALGHTEAAVPGYAPTCTENGATDGATCTVCGKTVVPQETIPATGHTEVIDAAVAPTDTATGLTEGKHCSVCDAVIVPQEIIPANFTIVDGVLTAYNGDRTDLVIPTNLGITAIGEGAFANCTSLATVLIPDTITAIGDGAFEGCSDDLVILSSDESCARTWAQANGVKWEHGVHTEETDPGYAPTCAEPGLTEGKHCIYCGLITVAQEVIPATGEHAWDDGEVTLEPTCTATGKMVFTCADCGTTKTEALEIKHLWAYGLLLTMPTEKEAGEMSYTCAECGATKTQKIVRGITGDVNEDGVVDMLDVICELEWFCGGVVELNLANGDVNGDAQPDMIDIITILAWYCGEDVELVSYLEVEAAE